MIITSLVTDKVRDLIRDSASYIDYGDNRLVSCRIEDVEVKNQYGHLGGKT